MENQNILFQDELCFKKAIMSPFSQSNWQQKLLIPAIIVFLAILGGVLFKIAPVVAILVLLADILVAIAFSGFVIQFQHNEIHGKMPLMSEFKGNFKKYIVLSLKNWVVAIVYMLAIDIIGLIMFAGGHYGGFWYLLIPVGLFALVFLFCLMTLAFGAFADTFSIKAALNFKNAFKLLCKVKLSIFMLFLFLISLGVMAQFAVLLLATTFVGLIFAPFVGVFHLLIASNATAQLYKVAKARLHGVIA